MNVEVFAGLVKSGASVPIIKRVKELSHNLSQRKRMCAERAFEREALRDVIAKKL